MSGIVLVVIGFVVTLVGALMLRSSGLAPDFVPRSRRAMWVTMVTALVLLGCGALVIFIGVLVSLGRAG